MRFRGHLDNISDNLFLGAHNAFADEPGHGVDVETGQTMPLPKLARQYKRRQQSWVAIGDEYAAELKLILQNDLGLICRSWVVWYYTFGVNCKYKFSRSHVHLFYFDRTITETSVCQRRTIIKGGKEACAADTEAGGEIHGKMEIRFHTTMDLEQDVTIEHFTPHP